MISGISSIRCIASNCTAECLLLEYEKLLVLIVGSTDSMSNHDAQASVIVVMQTHTGPNRKRLNVHSPKRASDEYDGTESTSATMVKSRLMAKSTCVRHVALYLDYYIRGSSLSTSGGPAYPQIQ